MNTHGISHKHRIFSFCDIVHELTPSDHVRKCLLSILVVSLYHSFRAYSNTQ